jgi:hypothetical protein
VIVQQNWTLAHRRTAEHRDLLKSQNFKTSVGVSPVLPRTIQSLPNALLTVARNASSAALLAVLVETKLVLGKGYLLI